MTRRSAFGLFVMVGLIAVGFGAVNAAAQDAQFAQAALCRVLSIQGMTCETCATHVQKELTKRPGVAEARVSYQKGEATVCTKAGADIPVTTLIKLVEKAGYKATLKR